MSDLSQEPGPDRGVRVWVLIVSLFVVALVVGGAVWILRTPPPTPAPATVTTITVETTSSVVPTTPATVATPTPAPSTIKEPALITNVAWSAAKGYTVTADYIQILTGKAASDAATAHGDESPPPNDYYILNDSPKLRTFALPKTASITVLGWAGADATAKKKISVGQFMDIMPGGTNPQDEWAQARYYLTVKDGKTVTKIEQIFFP
jgi:hypothetical protein